jgi:hypothetical protein
MALGAAVGAATGGVEGAVNLAIASMLGGTGTHQIVKIGSRWIVEKAASKIITPSKITAVSAAVGPGSRFSI